MNKENLLRMADYIETIPQEQFGMGMYRMGIEVTTTQKCGTVGCVIGHCTILDTPENFKRFKRAGLRGTMDFKNWSREFTGITAFSDTWNYLFSGNWEKIDNTPQGAAKRIREVVEHGLPERTPEFQHLLYKLIR